MLSLIQSAAPAPRNNAASQKDAAAHSSDNEANASFGQVLSQVRPPEGQAAPAAAPERSGPETDKRKEWPEGTIDPAMMAALAQTAQARTQAAPTDVQWDPTQAEGEAALPGLEKNLLLAQRGDTGANPPGVTDEPSTHGLTQKPDAATLQTEDGANRFSEWLPDTKNSGEGKADPTSTLSTFSAAMTQATTQAQDLRKADAAPMQATVQAPVHSPGFAPELSLTVATLAKRQGHEAQLQLNPSELGPIKVQVKVEGGEASVSFQAVQPETRAAIEAALPILKDMLTHQGLQLTHSSVSDQGRQPGFGERGASQQGEAEQPIEPPKDAPALAQRLARTAAGGIDLYA